MAKKILILILCAFASSEAFAQWEAGIGAGVALPVTGYGEVYKSGWLLNAEGKYIFNNGKFSTGLNIHFARLQNDKNPNDMFQNARLTVIPFIFFAEYEFDLKKIRPYVSAGIGLSMFNVTYDTSATGGYANFNVSFSMSPRIGVRYAVNEYFLPFVEGGLILLADGPPIYFPQSGKMTGYWAITVGVCMRWPKKG